MAELAANTTAEGNTSTPVAQLPPWAVVELMGHRLVAGRIRLVAIGGATMLEVDMQSEELSVVQIYNLSAVFSITACSESNAKRIASRLGETWSSARHSWLPPWRGYEPRRQPDEEVDGADPNDEDEIPF